jgi:hypothetical protein
MRSEDPPEEKRRTSARVAIRREEARKDCLSEKTRDSILVPLGE